MSLRGLRSQRRCGSRTHWIEQLEGRRLLNAADLDRSFSGDGQFLANDLLADVGSAVKRQGDGKLVVAGASITNAATFDLAFLVQRFNADGTPDDNFGTGGRVFTEFTTGGDVASDVLIQADGKIVAVGVANDSIAQGNASFALARYSADGTLDEGFGTLGRVATDLSSKRDSIVGATLQSDGKIVVVGQSFEATGPERFTVARYMADGTLDESFGTGGIFVAEFNDFAARASAVAIDSNGKIVVAGTSNASNLTSSENFAITRLNEDGSLDAAFDGDGKVVVDFEGNSDRAAAVAIQPDGKILVAGDASGFNTKAHFGAARLNADGSLDATWAGDGTLRLPLDAQQNRCGAVAVLVHSDGRVVLAGQQYPAAGTNTDFAIARVTETGEVDPTFGGDGIHTLDFGSAADQAADAILLPGDRILMVGSANGGPAARPFDTAMAQFEGGVDFAAMSSGTLSIVGTAGDDAIAFAREGQEYVVTRNGVTNRINAVQQSGDASGLNVLTLSGNDSVHVGLVRPGTISLGAGDDSATLAAGGVGALPLNIDGAAGGDTLNLPAGVVVPVTFNGGAGTGPNVVRFSGTDGDEAIEVGNASLTGAGTSAGFSSVHSVNVDARGGNDAVTWANDRPASIDLGDGNDSILFNRGTFFSVVTLSGGGGDDVVTASASGSANVTFDAGDGNDKVIYEGRNLGDTITFSATEVAGLPIVRFAALESLVVKGNGEQDEISGSVAAGGPAVEVDGGLGNDLMALTFASGAHVTVKGGDGTDELDFVGTAANDVISLGLASIDVSGEAVPYSGVEHVTVSGAAGADTIVFDLSLALPGLDATGGGDVGVTDVLRLLGTSGADAFKLVNDARVTHGARIIGLTGIGAVEIDAREGADTVDVQGTIPVRFPSSQDLAALTIGAAGRVELLGDGNALRTDALTIASGGRLDLFTGSLHVVGGDIKVIEGLMKTARDGGPVRWTAAGIGTRSAGIVTGLCAAEVATPTPGVMVKYTYNGDANLDGRINADDYFRIDSAFLAGQPEPLCSMGDFNFDDKVNADDYFLIDSAFLSQGQPLGAEAVPVPRGSAVAATVDEAATRAHAVKRFPREDLWSDRSKRRRRTCRR
jgi:uncharacterized delta-60 repeat protein